MSTSDDPWLGLKPEQEKFMTDHSNRQRKRVTWRMMLRLIGGYSEPRWWRDRRPQPLRSRRSVEHFRTLLRRVAVTRLRLEGCSFRQIGRELDVSQVAAWKLWQQVVEDVSAQVQAEHRGVRNLEFAAQQKETGNDAEMEKLRSQVRQHFGIRVANRFLGQ